MLKQALLFVIAVVLCVTAFFLAEQYLSPSFQTCLSQYLTNREGISATAAGYAYCSGNFISDKGTGITAFATLIMAAFTGTLWAATNRQALLTKEALIANNRAFVFAPSFSQFWEHDQKTDQYNWRLRPLLRNSGNTPTRNMTMFVECEIRNTPLPVGYTFTPRLKILLGLPFLRNLTLPVGSRQGVQEPP
jgi:hypothetical protein